ncbi:MAG: NTP transferase domain-containing protein [Solobacterium sp.]|nr:NTP transferase domain-containing protein [Solobacterium sp.]
MNNTLYYTKDTVTKVYRDRICFDHEKRIYDLLNHTGLIPDLLREETQTLVLERIQGMTFGETADTCADFSREVYRICQWYSALLDTVNELSGEWIVLDDLNPGNILMTPERVCGIDFEEYHTGNCTEACAVLCAMLACMRIPEKETYVRQVVVFFVKQYSLSMEDLMEELRIQIQKITERRNAMKLIRNSTAVILAGGQSRRMNSMPKGLLKLGEYTFMDHLLHTLQVFDDVRISANDDTYAEYTYPVIRDHIPGLGPVGALSSILAETDKDYVFVVPCDTPLLQRDTVNRCFLAMDEDTDAVILKTAEKTYPTIGIYRTSALPVIDAQIQAGNYRMMNVLQSLRTRYLLVQNAQELQNVNTLEDYLEIQKQ